MLFRSVDNMVMMVVSYAQDQSSRDHVQPAEDAISRGSEVRARFSGRPSGFEVLLTDCPASLLTRFLLRPVSLPGTSNTAMKVVF